MISLMRTIVDLPEEQLGDDQVGKLMCPEVHPLRLPKEHVCDQIGQRSPQKNPPLLSRVKNSQLRRKITEKDTIQEQDQYPSDRIEKNPQHIISFTFL